MFSPVLSLDTLTQKYYLNHEDEIDASLVLSNRPGVR
jgi:hypothetical protein